MRLTVVTPNTIKLEGIEEFLSFLGLTLNYVVSP